MKQIWKLTMGSVAVALTLATWSTSSFAIGTAEQRAACTPDVFRLCSSEIPNIPAHRRLPQAAKAESQQALPVGDELADRQLVLDLLAGPAPPPGLLARFGSAQRSRRSQS
jgi:hypothetical protein